MYMLVSLVIEIPSSLFSPFCKFFFLSWHLSSIDLAIVYTLIKRHYYNYYLTTLILLFFSFKFLGTPIILKNLTNYMTAPTIFALSVFASPLNISLLSLTAGGNILLT